MIRSSYPATTLSSENAVNYISLLTAGELDYLSFKGPRQPVLL